VGVKVSGSAQAPRVSLYAAPNLPDVDKLAWLVLGRPASEAGAQSFVLQQALRNVMANSGAPTEGGLADALQLDSIGLEDRVDASDPEATQTALVLGKRVSDRLYLSYERTLSGTMSTVSMLYQLSRRFTLRARTGTENAVDLIFTLQYR
jgi:translocation and assembly module TamB